VGDDLFADSLVCVDGAGDVEIKPDKRERTEGAQTRRLQFRQRRY
jgi:hypothetical protein